MLQIVCVLAMVSVDEPAVAGEAGARLVQRAPLTGEAVPGEGAAVCVVPGGGMQVMAAEQCYFIESSFSYPHDEGMRWNRLLCMEQAEGQKSWRPKVSVDGDDLVVVAKSSVYHLERRIRRREWGRVEVRDSIKNRTYENLGLAIEHRVITPTEPAGVLLAGRDTTACAPGSCPESPTVFVAQTASGLGMVAEDNALRLQLDAGREGNAAWFGAHRMGMAPGETYTLEWAVYPSKADYAEFTGALQEDWGGTWPGDVSCEFIDARTLATDKGKEQVRALLADKDVEVLALTPWFEYGDGWELDRPAFKQMMDKARAFVRELAPNAKIVACVETGRVPLEVSFFGDAIPEGWPMGQEAGDTYGQAATPEMAAVLDESPWRDSCVRNADGRPLLDCRGVGDYANQPAVNLLVYPEYCPVGMRTTRLSPYCDNQTPFSNHRHEQVLEQIAWLMDEAEFDGVFFGEFSMANGTEPTRWTRERWDGRTVELDASGRAEAKLGDTALISAGARRKWAEAVLRRGGVVVCDTPAAVNELQPLPIVRIEETR